jgi:hypothetical protein
VVKRGMMRRSGMVCGLSAETNGILSANPYCSSNIVQFYSPQSDNKGDAK